MIFLLWFLTLFCSAILLFPLIVRGISLIVRNQVREKDGTEKSFGCIITAYKDIELSFDLVQSLAEQTYHKYHVYVVADRCDRPINLPLENHPRITYLFPEVALNGKVNSMRYALSSFYEEHEQIVIFDPDNFVDNDFLIQLNSEHQKGFEVVQAQRVARNIGTDTALMDAMSEYFRNYNDRLIPFRLGLSCSISGSGMSIPYQAFKNFLNSKEILEKSGKVILGEDKMLQVSLINKNYFIAYAPEVKVQDGKLENGSQVEKQRARWVTAYFESLKSHLFLLYKGIISWDLDMVFFAIQTSIPPIFTLLLLSVGLLVANYFASLLLLGVLSVSLLLYIINIYSIILIEFSKGAHKWASLKLPIFVFRHLISIIHIPKTKNNFLVTQHRFHKKES